MSANIILKASDDGQYTVEKKVAEKSGLIKMMIDGESDLFYLSQEGEDEGSAKQGWKWEEDVKSGRDYARVYATVVSRYRQSRHHSLLGSLEIFATQSHGQGIIKAQPAPRVNAPTSPTSRSPSTRPLRVSPSTILPSFALSHLIRTS